MPPFFPGDVCVFLFLMIFLDFARSSKGFFCIQPALDPTKTEIGPSLIDLEPCIKRAPQLIFESTAAALSAP